MLSDAFYLVYESITGKFYPTSENPPSQKEVHQFLDQYLDEKDRSLYSELTLESLVSMLSRIEKGFDLVRRAIYILQAEGRGEAN